MCYCANNDVSIDMLNDVRDDVHIQLATLNGKLPVLGGWVSGLAINMWQFEYFLKKTNSNHDHTPQTS